MAEYLVIRLHESAPGEGSWIVVDAAGPRVGTAGRGPLADALRHAQDKRVVVLVPGTRILMTSATLPVRGAAKMLQVVPFALEEQLAQDVDALHFAIGRRRDDGSVPVAVVERDAMDHWLALLAEAGIQPAFLVPDTVGVPVADQGASILVEGARVYLRDESGCVAAFPADEVGHYAEALGLAAATAASDDEDIDAQTDTAVTIYIGTDERDRHDNLLATLQQCYPGAGLKTLPNGAFARLAVNASADPEPNLLQGSYAPRTNIERYWRPWRVAAMLLGAFIVTMLGVKAGDNMRLAREEARVDADMREVFERAMPGSRAVEGQLRFQMERRLAELRGGGSGGSDFLGTLDILASALAGNAGAELENMVHQNRIMSIKLSAPSVETLDKIKQSVDDAGLKAEISSAEPSDSGVDGRMRLSPGESA